MLCQGRLCRHESFSEALPRKRRTIRNDVVRCEKAYRRNCGTFALADGAVQSESELNALPRVPVQRGMTFCQAARFSSEHCREARPHRSRVVEPPLSPGRCLPPKNWKVGKPRQRSANLRDCPSPRLTSRQVNRPSRIHNASGARGPRCRLRFCLKLFERARACRLFSNPWNYRAPNHSGDGYILAILDASTWRRSRRTRRPTLPG